MRVLLSTWGSRGDVEPLVGLAVRLKELGAEAVVCAPPEDDFAEMLERVGVPHVPFGPTVRSIVARDRPPTAEDAFRLAAQLVDARFETHLVAAEGCDAMMVTGLMPSGARSVADKLGIRYVCATFHTFGLPSHHFPPGRRPGTPSPPDETDIEELWKQDAQRVNALYAEAENRGRAKLGLPPVDNVRDYVFSSPMWLAADPILVPGKDLVDVDIVQTGAWILPDERVLAPGLEAFLDAGEPPVFVGFGSAALHATKKVATVAVQAIRAQGRRMVLARGWAELVPADDRDDCFLVGEVNHQKLFPRMAAVVHHGGIGTTTTATRAGVPQVVVPQFADQPFAAARVAELGIGAAHDGPAPTVESFSAALATALRPQVRSRAASVAGQIRVDGTTVAAKLLLDK